MWEKKYGGVAQEENYIMTESIQVWRQRKVEALHPFQKNKKVRAAKTGRRKAHRGVGGRCLGRREHPNNCRRQELGRWHDPPARE